MNKELFLASERGDLTKIQQLQELHPGVLREVTFQDDTAVHMAARKGHLDLVRWILRMEPSLKIARNKDENTPLHEAAKSGNPDLIPILLHEGRYIFHVNNFGETALVIASQYGHVITVRFLLEARSYENSFEWNRSVREAAYRGYKDVLMELLNKDPSGILRDTHYVPASSIECIPVIPILHAAVSGGYLEIVKAILDHPSWESKLMKEEDADGRCAVHVAAMKGYWDIVTEFISKMPDCAEIRSSDHRSVLHFAVEHNQLKLVKNLLKNKEDEKVTDLVSRDHDLSLNTALHLAALNAVDPQIVEYLVSFPSVDVNALNSEGKNALDIATAAAKDKPNCAIILEILERGEATKRIAMPERDKDTVSVNTHMVVASLIATVTFAAMFQIPGGIEDDKNSIHYGAAKLALYNVFRLFILSDTAAFTASLTVVVGWLVRQQLQDRYFRSSLIYMLLHFSEVNLLVSICWTLVAFVSATIIVIKPRDLESLRSKDKEAFLKYETFFRYEMILATATPYFVAGVFFLGLEIIRFLKFDRYNIFKMIRSSRILPYLGTQFCCFAIVILCFTFK